MTRGELRLPLPPLLRLHLPRNVEERLHRHQSRTRTRAKSVWKSGSGTWPSVAKRRRWKTSNFQVTSGTKCARSKNERVMLHSLPWQPGPLEHRGEPERGDPHPAGSSLEIRSTVVATSVPHWTIHRRQPPRGRQMYRRRPRPLPVRRRPRGAIPLLILPPTLLPIVPRLPVLPPPLPELPPDLCLRTMCKIRSKSLQRTRTSLPQRSCPRPCPA